MARQPKTEPRQIDLIVRPHLFDRHKGMKAILVEEAERTSKSGMPRSGKYHGPQWKLVQVNVGTYSGFDKWIYTIARLIGSHEEHVGSAWAYSKSYQCDYLVDPRHLTWLEDPAPVAPTPVGWDVVEPGPEQTESLAPGAAWDARFKVRAAWSYPDGLTVEETVDPEGVVRYSVRDKHGCSGEAESLSEATREMWISVCLDGWCEICEDHRVEVVCAPEILGAHYFGLCQACYLDRPIEPDHIDEWFDLEVWRTTAACPEHADCFGKCWRDSPVGTHLHLVERTWPERDTMVVGVRASGAEWFELVGRPVPLSSYIDLCRHGAERYSTCG